MRSLQAIVVAAALLAGSQQVTAQEYPSRPVKIVVPFAAGSSTDILARVLAKDFQQRLGQRRFHESTWTSLSNGGF